MTPLRLTTTTIGRVLLASPLLAAAASALPVGLPIFALSWTVLVWRFVWSHRGSNWTRWAAIPGALGFVAAITTMLDRLSMDVNTAIASEQSTLISMLFGVAIGCYLTLCLATEMILRDAEMWQLQSAKLTLDSKLISLPATPR